MKKLLFILSFIFFSVVVNAQQTEDEVYVGKKYGNYHGTGIIIPETDKTAKPINGEPTVTGIVISTCKQRCNSFTVQKEDGTLIVIGTKDNGFTIPKNLIGKKIIVEGVDSDKRVRERRIPRTDFQKDIQFAASGIIVVN